MTPDVAASIRARLVRVGQQAGEEFERTAVAGCFERRGTRWSEERPEVLTRPFHEHAQLRARWSGYVNGSAVQEMPPLDFTTIGERLIAFLGPVRDAIVGSDLLNARWVPAGVWERTEQDST